MLFSRRKPVVHETTFQTPDLGNLIMLRLTAFIRDHKASLQSIDEHGAKLEVGGPSFGDRLFGRSFVPLVKVALEFGAVDHSAAKSWNKQTEIAVRITPGHRHSPRFEEMANHVSRELKGYFAAV